VNTASTNFPVCDADQQSHFLTAFNPGRAYRAVFSNPDEKINALATELLNLTKSLNQEAIMQMALIVHEIRENECMWRLLSVIYTSAETIN
jgi:hypothetical protein